VDNVDRCELDNTEGIDAGTDEGIFLGPNDTSVGIPEANVGIADGVELDIFDNTAVGVNEGISVGIEVGIMTDVFDVEDDIKVAIETGVVLEIIEGISVGIPEANVGIADGVELDVRSANGISEAIDFGIEVETNFGSDDDESAKLTSGTSDRFSFNVASSSSTNRLPADSEQHLY